MSRIGVIYGGPSVERPVSLESGEAVAAGLETLGGYDVVRLNVADAEDTAAQLDRQALDAAFIALHGEFGEDGGVQTLLEERAIPYTGSEADSSHLCIDKSRTKRVAHAAGLPTPDWIDAGREDPRQQTRQDAEAIGYPLVVKPNKAGSSLGISIVNEPAQLDAALDLAFALDESVLMEAFIEGSELTVSILGGRALPVIQVSSRRAFYDYKAKYLDSTTRYQCPAPLAPHVYRSVGCIAELAFQRLHCRDLARIDFMLPHGGQLPYLIEANTIPGFTSHSLLPKAAWAAGKNFPELCGWVADQALARGGMGATDRESVAVAA
jgi:D-alanine-D-alanine ligase